jgi:hypothetical protein
MEQCVKGVVPRMGAITVLMIVIKMRMVHVGRYDYFYNQNDQTKNSVQNMIKIVRRAPKQLVSPAKSAIFMIIHRRPAKM